MMMTMDDEMMVEQKGDRSDLEMDFDYEFDAAKYFNFCREETFNEALEAQRWFDTCQDYPPSPFVAELNIGGEFIHENVNTLPKVKDAIYHDTAESNIGCALDFSAHTETSTDKVYRVQFSMNLDASREDTKFMKGPFSKGSTLMKPTLSFMAKQNRIRDAKRTGFTHRSTKLLAQKHGKVTEDSVENAGHASKRQKLEEGNSWKVAGINEHTTLSHKAPQKKSLVADAISHQSRLRVTIPREPELETSQRAQRQRIERLRSNTANQPEDGKTPPTSMFKARPFNRKIFEASSIPLAQKSTPRQPQFQPFHLKTDERALLHSATNSLSGARQNPFLDSTVQDSGLFIGNLGQPLHSTSIPQNAEPKKDGSNSAKMKFKAQPLNKKVLSSKGDIGIFRSAKKEATKPKEFNFSTSRRHQHDPPTEFFNKLSLNTDTKDTMPGAMFQRRANDKLINASKMWKENRDCNVHNEGTRIFR